MRLLPGDPILMVVSKSSALEISQQQLDDLRHEYGLDKPLVVQYINWISGIFQGDFGKSISMSVDVRDLIFSRIPTTLILGSLAFIIGFIVGLVLGVASAVRRGSWIDNLVSALANIGITVPVFWLAIVLIYLVALELKWLPVYGYVSPLESLSEFIRHATLPILCLAVGHIALVARQSRSSVLEVLHEDYIRTAWSKGLSEHCVIIRHTLKNALIPVITLIGLGVANILGGAVLIEQVFNIPGMGRLTVLAILNQDYTLIQSIALIVAVIVVFVNLIVDISLGWFNPKIRYS
jgi:peptide/nickel transport system permease protein